MNIILISSNSRPLIFQQTVASMISNSADWKRHHLTVVWNGDVENPPLYNDVTIIAGNVGASAARNIGASSIPQYRRQEYVCFFDDDVYCMPGWDRQIEDALKHSKSTRPVAAVVSGHAHPYNHTILDDRSSHGYKLTTVLSTVNIVCAWSIWGIVGWFAEPGGPGGSEDVDWCARATRKGYDLAVTSPQCVIHTGLTSSSGKPIVGADQVRENNAKLEIVHGIQGKVVYT